MSKKIVKREVRFAVHIPKSDYREDCHFVKEHVHYEDGTSGPSTYLVKEFQRPLWVTRPEHRNHKDKKEFEQRDKTIQVKCTESDLNRRAAEMLDMPHLATQPKKLKDSPYLYGFDRTSTSIIKLQNLMKNEFIQTPYSVAGFDIETDIDTLEILMATVVYRGKVEMSILSKYLANVSNYTDRLNKAIEKYLPEYANKIQVVTRVFETEVELLADVFRVANEWAPDFLAIWNINFDMKRIMDRLKVHNVDPKNIICDQNVPRAYRYCRYKEGITRKETASGKSKPINPSLQWHYLTSTSTFYAIDAMCVYRQLRIAKPEEPSYSLDAILQRVLKKRKLTFTEADAYEKEAWHRFMQKNYPIEYMVYNIFDCLGMLEIEEKTKDLCNSLPAGAGITDFAKFNSNPRKIVDALFLFGLERGVVVGTAGNVSEDKELADCVPDELLESVIDADDDDEDDGPDENGHEDQNKYTGLGLAGWIQMLQQNLLLNEGLKIFHDFPEVVSNFRGTVYDVDATAAYPTATLVGNVSKATCVNEVISIAGIAEDVFREQNLTVCLGGMGVLEYHSVMYDLPTLDSAELEDFLMTV
ncbi:MAG: 3'-5' exonuclease [Candidatus Nanopelagicales bacterium]|nr:3'-5' exonuclease [Candidatus Nanopelagicales bacterium]